LVRFLAIEADPLASRTADGVQATRANSWDPYIIPTEAAMPWLADQDLGDAPVITATAPQTSRSAPHLPTPSPSYR